MTTARVSIDGTTITGTYTVDAGGDPPPGDMQFALMVTSPLGVVGAGFQNAAAVSKSGGRCGLGADVAGVHLSLDAGKTWRPIRAGAGSSDKSRICGMQWSADESTLWVYTTGHDSGVAGGTTGEGVAGNYLLKNKLSASGEPDQWVEVAQITGGWASAQNDYQKGDTKASAASGHPRHSKNRCLLLDEGRGFAYCGSADGVWRVPLAGGTPVRVWGAGNAVTSLVMDPNDSTVIYATVDLGPKVGVWRVTGMHASATDESGCTGTKFDYPQSVDAVKVGGKTALIVATGRLITGADRANSVQWLPPGATFAASSWRDISGAIMTGDTTGKARVSGVAIRPLATGNFAVAASSSYDVNPGGTTPRVWWDLSWNGTGSPAWSVPESGNTTYRLGGGAAAEEWWFKDKQPTLMGDKAGFDSVSPVFVDDETILWPGRSGVWRYRASLGARAFHPVVSGVLATYAWCILSYAADAAGRKVVCGDTDWGDLYLPAPWAQPSMRTGSPRMGSGTSLPAFGLAQTDAGAVAVAGGEGGNGECRVSQSPFAAAPVWVDELGTGTNKPPKGECRGVELWGSGASQVLLVAVQGSGVWHKYGSGASGAWTKVLADAAATGKQTRVRFGKSGNTVVACDQGAGIYRSTDQGATWATLHKGASGGITSGHVTPDPVVAGRFYIVHGGDIKLVTSGSSTVTVYEDFKTAQGFAVDPVTATKWVAEGGSAKLWKQPSGGSWADVTTSSWRQTCGIVRDMTITPEGILLVANQAAYCGTLTRA